MLFLPLVPNEGSYPRILLSLQYNKSLDQMIGVGNCLAPHCHFQANLLQFSLKHSNSFETEAIPSNNLKFIEEL